MISPSRSGADLACTTRGTIHAQTRALLRGEHLNSGVIVIKSFALQEYAIVEQLTEMCI